MGRHGIPQGSAASSLVAEIVISYLLRLLKLPKGTAAYTWVDDILVLTENDARDVENALTSVAERLRVSPLRFKTLERRRVCDGFDFLSYRFRSKHGKAKVKPSLDAHLEFSGKLWHEVEKAVRAGEPMDGALTYARRWARAFPPWEWPDVILRFTVGTIENKVRASMAH